MRTLHDGKFLLLFPRYIRISSDEDDRGIFWGLKFSIPGFYWVAKIGKYIFGWLDLKQKPGSPS